MWSTLSVGVGQPPIQQLHLENGVFLFWSLGGEQKGRKKDHREGHTKEEGEGLGVDQNKLCSTNVNVAFFFPGLGDLKALPDAEWRGENEEGTEEEGVKWERQNKSKAEKQEESISAVFLRAGYF